MLFNTKYKELHLSVCLVDLVPDLTLSGKYSLSTIDINVYVSCVLTKDDTCCKLADPAGELVIDPSVFCISYLLGDSTLGSCSSKTAELLNLDTYLDLITELDLGIHGLSFLDSDLVSFVLNFFNNLYELIYEDLTCCSVDLGLNVLDGSRTGELTSEGSNDTFLYCSDEFFLFDTSLLGQHLDRVKYVVLGFLILNLLCHYMFLPCFYQNSICLTALDISLYPKVTSFSSSRVIVTDDSSLADMVPVYSLLPS